MSRKHLYGEDKSQLPCGLLRVAENLLPAVPSYWGYPKGESGVQTLRVVSLD